MASKSPKIKYLKVKDHSVSGENFELLYNETLDMLLTHPKPKNEELNKYYESEDYISHTDTKRNIFEYVYHLVRSIALKRKLRLINSFKTESKSLFDIGCGTGDFLEIALKNNWSVSGIEPDDNARAIANKKTTNKVFEASHLTTLKDHSFDVITLWHVLEHVPDLETQIKTIKRLLKPSGVLIIAVPNFKSFDAKYYGEFWAAYDVPRHLWHFSKNSIQQLFEKEQMILKNVKPMPFDSYYVSLLSEKYKNRFMNPFKAFWVGWRSNRKARHSKEHSSHIYILKHQNT